MTTVALSTLAVASTAQGAGPRQGNRAARGSAIPGKVLRYCEHLVHKHDRDGSGRLELEEWRAITPSPAKADADGDAILSANELARYVADYGRGRRIRLKVSRPWELRSSEMPPLLRPATASTTSTPKMPKGTSSGRRRQDSRFFTPPDQMPSTLPKWFLARDTNGDGQVSLAEYAPKSTESRLKEFAGHDANGDGVLTPQECRPQAEQEKAEKKKSPKREKQAPEAQQDTGDQGTSRE